MINYFSNRVIIKAKQHAIKCFPEEACGLVIKDTYIPCENIADNKLNDFKIDTKIFIKNIKEIEAVIHSHNNFPHASKKDVIQQRATKVPWGVINVFKGNTREVFFWGDSLPVQDLVGRPFINGVYDCYGLVRDYYRKNKNTTLLLVEHEIDFYNNNEHLLTDNFKEAGFVEVEKKDLKNGDVVFGSVLSNIVNHCGIYIGNGLILHHLSGRLSRTEPLVRWEKYITHYLRYEGVDKC